VNEFRDGGVCFGCGKGNPRGLQLEFRWEGDLMVSDWTPAPEHQGWEGHAHGGMVALVLDEVMAQCVNRCGYLTPTAEISVRFRKPALVGEPLRLTATKPAGRRLLTVRAEARDRVGTLMAEATAKFLPFPRGDR
jgi:acyl-coenzyme A thioesterase PaaI-like protein